MVNLDRQRLSEVQCAGKANVGRKGTGKSKKRDRKKASGKQSKSQPFGEKKRIKGRVVITHSTYIPGLIDTLERLADRAGIQTITPAVISRTKSNSPHFRLKVSVPIRGGHKLIARKGKSTQEVFVITAWTKGELEQAIAQILS